jgi:hypothetical protein
MIMSVHNLINEQAMGACQIRSKTHVNHASNMQAMGACQIRSKTHVNHASNMRKAKPSILHYGRSMDLFLNQENQEVFLSMLHFLQLDSW